MSFDLSHGRQILGKVKFSLKNQEFFNLAIAAFNKYSKYKNNITYINYFVQALEITSSLEAGFDGINTYDNAGISVGFIQFARPDQNVFKLLNLFNPTLALKVKNSFGNSDPYSDAKSMKGRIDDALITEVRNAITTPAGIDAQFHLAITDFYDVSFERFLSLKFSPEPDRNPLNSGVSTVVDKNQYKIYANGFIFDTCVNKGTGTRFKIKQITNGGVDMTEGDFLNYYTNNLNLRPERKEYWQEVIAKNFTNV